MDKKKILALVIEAILKQKEELAGSAASAQEEKKGTPTAMESHSDRTRYELEVVQVALADTIEEYKLAVKKLQAFSLPEKSSEKIELGSVVETEDATHATKFYFFLPEGKGISVVLGGIRYSPFTPETPLGKALAGKKAGDMVTLNGRYIKVISVI